MTTLNKSNNVEQVIADNLCMGCGTCVAFCPQSAVAMKESPAGLLCPEIDYKTCNFCGLCLKVCPGIHLEKGTLKKNMDPFKGEIIGVFIGKVTDNKLLAESQSGGIATALLSYLIKVKEIDHALVTKMPFDGTLRPKTIVTSDISEIHKARGSKYCPVALNASIKDIPGNSNNIAIVGLPCHFHGLHNARSLGLSIPAEIKLAIGLMCDRTLTFQAIDFLIQQSKVCKNEIIGFEFRSKKWRGWPGDVCVHTTDGNKHYVSRKKRKLIKDIFTPARCRLCFDKFNVLSDITIGDAWGYSNDEQGSSVIIARTNSGLNTLLTIEKLGKISLKSIKPDSVFEKQAVENRRRDWSYYTKAWEKMGKKKPVFTVESKFYINTNRIRLHRYQRELKRAVSLGNLKSKKQIENMIKRYIFRIKLSTLPIIKKIVKHLRRWV